MSENAMQPDRNYLCNWKARYFSTLVSPGYFHVVDAEFIPERGGLMLTITADKFQPVAPGEPIPELAPI